MSYNSINAGKLVFGCARLSSLSRNDIFDLIEECIQNKILHFDTAPNHEEQMHFQIKINSRMHESINHASRANNLIKKGRNQYSQSSLSKRPSGK